MRPVPFAGAIGPSPFSLVLGAELQPGLYKLRLWATCTPSVQNQRVAVELLEKAPADLNLVRSPVKTLSISNAE